MAKRKSESEKIQDEINKTYDKYKKKTNMTFTELMIWSKNPASKAASLNRQPIYRNLTLLSKPKHNWAMRDMEEANKTISFIARMKKQPAGARTRFGMSKRTISLMNWGFNPYKTKKKR